MILELISTDKFEDKSFIAEILESVSKDRADDKSLTAEILDSVSKDKEEDNSEPELILELVSKDNVLDNEVSASLLNFVSEDNDDTRISFSPLFTLASILTNLLNTVPANSASPLNAAANSPRVSNIDGEVPINVEI